MIVNPLDFIYSFLSGIFALWPILLFTSAVLLLRLAAKQIYHARLSRAGLFEIDKMTGREFEVFLATLFRNQGYAVNLTPYQNDYGADLIASDSDSERLAIQAKRHSRNVGVKAVQEICAAKSYYKCNSGIVITNSHFTEQAKKLAAANDVQLWDRDKLAGIIRATCTQELAS